MEPLSNQTVEERSIWEFKGYDDFIDEWALMATPFPVLLIFTAYLLFVLKVGPAYMKKRQPFSLNNIIFLYNIFQVAASVYVFIYGTRLLLRTGIVDSLCELDKKNIEPLAIGIYYYVAAKISELLDTVFFVLRKKYNQVTFLHVYHHAMMVLVSWYTLKYEPTYTIVFLGTLNSFIHIVMYTYYALSTFPALSKYLWWKKYITSMQLIQFCLIILQVGANAYITGCPPSHFLLSIILMNTMLMIYLFSDFYTKTYLNDSITASKVSTKTEVNEVKNGRKFSEGIANSKEIHEKSQ